MANTTTTEVSSAVSAFYNRTLLSRAVANFVHNMFGQVRNIPKNNSEVIKFRKYGSLTAATTALTQGSTPSGSQLSVTDITATVAQYGDYVTITDFLMFTTFDPILTETAEILGEQAGDTLDQVCRDVLAAGTNVSYGGDATSRVTVDSTDLIDATVIKKAVRTLKNNNAKRITRMINASTGVGTVPVAPSFVGIVHPNTTYTLEGLTGYKRVEEYGSTTTLLPYEVGKMPDVRFVESTNAKKFSGAGASSIDVYATIIFGMEAYGTTAVNGEAIRNIVKPLGSAGTADPLEQRATSGWKATFVAKILQQPWIVRIEHAVAS